MSTFIVIAFFIALVSAAYLIYVKINSERYVRERYMFSCLVTSASICAAALAAISSREGLADHLYEFGMNVAGASVAPAPPAPFSEKALIAMIAMFSIFHIWKSPAHWSGQISADEAEKRRRNDDISMIREGLNEGLRIVIRSPARQARDSELIDTTRIILPEPKSDLVWHENARQLIQLWDSSIRFSEGDSRWDERERCWYASHKLTGRSIIIHCIYDLAEDTIERITAHGKKIFREQPFDIYVAIRNGDCELTLAESGGVPVSMFSEEYLLDNLVDFSDYFFDIRERVETSPLPESNLKLVDIYVPSDLMASGTRTLTENMEEFLGAWARDATRRPLAILGEYGQGKSTGALMFIYHAILTNFLSSGGRIPLLLELRGKSPANLAPEELIATWAQLYTIKPSAIMKLISSGKVIVILEGFDEMANVADIESRLAQFSALWKLYYKRSKIVFTGRRNLFFLEKEIDIIFGGIERSPADPYCEILQLCPFNPTQVERGLRWAAKDVREEILEVAGVNTQMMDVASRPSLLYILGLLWPEIRKTALSGRITPADVISKFIEHSYRRQAEKAISSTKFMALIEGERRYFHEGLAMYMRVRTGASNQLSSNDFSSGIDALYREYPDDAHIFPPAITEGSPRPLKIRLADVDNAMELVSTDVRAHGIIVSDLARRGAFKFAHKSFFEVLAAKVAASSLLHVNNSLYVHIKRAANWSIKNIADSSDGMKFFGEILIEEILRENQNKLCNRAFDAIFRIRSKNIITDIGNRLFKRPIYVFFARLWYDKRFRRKIVVSYILLSLMVFVFDFAGIKYSRVALSDIPGTVVQGTDNHIIGAVTQDGYKTFLNIYYDLLNGTFSLILGTRDMWAQMVVLLWLFMYVPLIIFAFRRILTAKDHLVVWAGVFLLTGRRQEFEDTAAVGRRAAIALLNRAEARWTTDGVVESASTRA